MEPRQIVKQSLAFAGPPRIPYGMGGGFPSDLRIVHRQEAKNSRARGWQQNPNGSWDMIDEWGNTWGRLEGITKGEVIHGAIEEDWSLLNDYEFPHTDDPELYVEARDRCRQFHDEGYFVLGSTNWPFNVARYLRRMENFLADVAGEPARVRQLLDCLADCVEAEIIGMADAGVDAIMTGEDWGTQDRLLVSPASFRVLFKPVFQRLCDVAHARGLSVWFHSCGYVRDIIGDWLEVGIDVCQFDQPELHGIDFLAEQFGGEMHFWCPVDIQKALQTRDLPTIEAAAWEYVDKLAAYGGGFIAGYYGSNEAIGLDPVYQEAACRAFMAAGDPPPWRR
ncbi:MAG: uroporphyrinogen decarboxylase family protein [Candidatus Zipacnadales bacterium]